VTYPNNGFGQALQAVAGAMSKDTRTKVFWVQTGGFDTHASQDTMSDTGAYVRLMVSLNDGLTALHADLRNSGLLNDTLLLSFSEFGAASPRTAAGHRPRLGEHHDGDGRRRARRPLRHGAFPQS
jgi:uncharacterized protein (DUF1501 family)